MSRYIPKSQQPLSTPSTSATQTPQTALTQRPTTTPLQPNRPDHIVIDMPDDTIQEVPGSPRGSFHHVIDIPQEVVQQPEQKRAGWDFSLRKTVGPFLKGKADAALDLGKNSKLSKQTTAWSSILYSKIKSTIAEPQSMDQKRESVFDALGKPAKAKVDANLPQVVRADNALDASLATAHNQVRALANNDCKALHNRLDAATKLFTALKTGGDAATRAKLHALSSSTLKPTAFGKTAAMVKAVSAYGDRQTTGVHASKEAMIEQGLKTLNLARDAEAYGLSVGGPGYGTGVAPAAADPAELHNNLAALRTTKAAALTGLNGFAADYREFITQELGCSQTTVDKLQSKIDQVVDPATSPGDRNSRHAEVMAIAVADRRLDKAVNSVRSHADRDALRQQFDQLTADPVAQQADRPIIDLVARLTESSGIVADQESAKEFLQAMADMKGPPLDETLRVSKSIYRTEFTPTPSPGGNDPVADWHDNRAKDLEKVNVELTSIALHVRQAAHRGQLDDQLSAVFPRQAGGQLAPEAVQIKTDFEASFANLRNRAPGTPVSAQDKLNVKLAKCFLDNGEAVKGIASMLKHSQENFATELQNSPDMLKLLKGGSTGASYDPVEQRANAATRLDNLNVGIAEAKRAIGDTSDTPRDHSEAAVAKAIDDAQRLLDNRDARLNPHRDALERHLFLMKNYVRQENSTDPRELLRQLADNDPRCGTDAIVAENVTLYGNVGVSVGAKDHNSGVSGFGAIDTAHAYQTPVARNPLVRNSAYNNVVLTESTAYSIKSICKLEQTNYKGTLRGGGNVGYAMSDQEAKAMQSAMSFAAGETVGYERVSIENSEPGLACMVHKSPVLDGTAKNAKISNATYIGMNDAINRALIEKPATPAGVTVRTSATVPGLENLGLFLATTDRATLEPLETKREVTTTWSTQHGASLGASHAKSMNEGNLKGTLGLREAGGLDEKFSHAYREETIKTPTLDKVTTSDTFSDTHSASAGTSMRLGGALGLDGGVSELAHAAAKASLTALEQVLPADSSVLKSLTETTEGLKAANDAVAKLRVGASIDLAKMTRGIEHGREYKEDYKRVVRDQFGNEIPSLVRDSRTATDGRLLVNNIVNDVGLLNATIAQRIDDGGGTMSPLEKETLSKLLCISAIASHYENAGALDGAGGPPNDNLTINVTASLTPAASARHAAVKAGIGRPATEGEQSDIRGNSLNYVTLGAAGGFKNQNTKVNVAALMARSKRSTSSAQSAGYPSGADMLSTDRAADFQAFLDKAENQDIKTALAQVGMDKPVQLLRDYIGAVQVVNAQAAATLRQPTRPVPAVEVTDADGTGINLGTLGNAGRV